MKKLFYIISMCFILLLSGCAAESHASDQSILDEFMTDFKAQDYESAAQYISSTTLDSYQSLQSLVTDEAINDIVLKQMSDIEYQVISSDLSDENGSFEVRVVYRNVGGAFMNAIGSMYLDASEGNLSAQSPAEVSQYISALLYEHLDTELETMDRERTINLIKEDNEWRIVMTDDFKNVLSANLMNAIEELKLMGVQF